MKLDFIQPVHNAVENELSLFHMVNTKGIVFNIGAVETASTDNKPLEFNIAPTKR